MDTTNTLWLDAYINDLEVREANHRRDSTERCWDGYCPRFFEDTGTDESAWNDIRRRERMAEACYEI